MKKCEKCEKIVFACCGNEPGRLCHRCSESASAKQMELQGTKPYGKSGGALDG